MELDTPTIRRLRDRLLAMKANERGEGDSSLAGSGLDREHQISLEQIAPLAEVLFVTMATDQAQAPSENAAIRNAIAVLTDDLLPGKAIDRFLAELEERLAREGEEARLEAIASRFALDKPGAEAAFTLAAAIALSDGRVVDAERTLIDRMRRYFGISADRAQALLDGAPAIR